MTGRGETSPRNEAPTRGVEERQCVTCELPLAPSSAALDDEVVAPTLPPDERFLDHGEIARGGMGTVRRVYDRVLNREVAMKVSDASHPQFRQTALRFIEEAQITGQLDHPNIVPVYDLGAASGGPPVFFTMKLVNGQTLTQVFAPLHAAAYSHEEVERALQIFLKICDAISFAHSRGVVHRDLKPDNVMVGSHGQVYVMDWGIAHLVEGERLATDPLDAVRVSLPSPEDSGSIVGTFDYMSPEQAWGRTDAIDARTDVFGLGGILYYLLTGHGPNATTSPFDSLQAAQRGQVRSPAVGGAWPELPPGLCEIVEKALAREPDDRYQSVAELRAAVEDFLRGGGWFQSLEYPPGAVIVAQGDAADCAYIITRGECEVSKGDGTERSVLRRLGEGDVFGETAVLTGGVRTATVTALTEVTVKVVTRSALERELGRRSWGGAFVRALAERFRDVDEQLAELRRKFGER